MKKILASFIIVVFLFPACKKDIAPPDNNTVGTISCKIEEKVKKFNTSVKAEMVSVVSPYKLRIKGFTNPGSEEDIEITIVSPNPIVPGTYSNYSGPGISVRIIYYSGNGFLGTTHDSWEQVGSLRRDGDVTISEINSLALKGTFSGTLFYSDFIGTDLSGPLSNGMYNVSF